MPKISVCVPFHQTEKTAFFLSRLLKTLDKQSFKDYELILTSDGPFAKNHNSAITKATGEIVQMMQMDDYFTHGDSLATIVSEFEKNPDKAWAITACMHHLGEQSHSFHMPEWTDDIYTGNNRLGSVTTLSFRRDKGLLFEEPLSWVVDCDLYYRLYLKYGLPLIIQTPNVSIDTRTDRLSHTLSDEFKASEINYLTKKYAK